MRHLQPRCWACLVSYTTLMALLTAVYLLSSWGRLGEVQLHSDSDPVMNNVNFAELVVVFFFHALHLVCLALFLFGYRSKDKMTLGCSLLLACTLVYILFYGCIILVGLLEKQSALGYRGAVETHPHGKETHAYEAEVDGTDGAIAVAGAAAVSFGETQREASRATAKRSSGSLGTCGVASVRTGELLTYIELGWTVLETLVEVLATIISGPDTRLTGDGDSGASFRRHPDGTSELAEVPFSGVHRTSLCMLNLVGLAFSIWGIMQFGVSLDAPPLPLKNLSSRHSAAALSELLVARGDSDHSGDTQAASGKSLHRSSSEGLCRRFSTTVQSCARD